MNVTSSSSRASRAARVIRVNDANAEAGFTLVELSVVVTIVGILAVLAVVGYRRLVSSSHLTEATGIVNGIRVAQESYHAETGYYANISGGAPINWVGGTGGCPAGAGTLGHGTQKYGWNPACGAGYDGPFQNLPLHIDTAVQYGYATSANHQNGSSFLNTIPNNLAGSPVATISSAPTGDWYAVSAVGNPSGDGTTQSAVFGNSVSNQLIIQGDGN
jgi:type IV pilus assembly protein PilA